MLITEPEIECKPLLHRPRVLHEDRRVMEDRFFAHRRVEDSHLQRRGIRRQVRIGCVELRREALIDVVEVSVLAPAKLVTEFKVVAARQECALVI